MDVRVRVPLRAQKRATTPNRDVALFNFLVFLVFLVFLFLLLEIKLVIDTK
jgi:hypothetical protein